MASVEVTISGVLYDKVNRTTQPVVLIGEATLTGLGIGGGPIIPPSEPKPPQIWGGGNEPFPTPPIPVYPGGSPDPPKPPETIAPPVTWKPVWLPEQGWVAVGVINPDIPHPTPSR